MAYTDKSEQQIINELIGNTPISQSTQEALSTEFGYTFPQSSEQRIIATESEVSPVTSQSEQQMIYNNVASSLGLTEPYTSYSVQELLRRSQIAGLSIDQIIGGQTLSSYIKSLSGLVAYYPLDETSGNAINQAPDTLGTLDGTVTGATQGVEGLVGNAYSFDGVNDKVAFGDIPAINDATELTVVALVKCNNVTQDHYIYGNIGGAANGFFLYADDVGFETGRTDMFKIFTQSGGSTYVEGSTGQNAAGVWKMPAFTFKGGTATDGLRLYVNGVLDRVAGTSSNANVGLSNTALQIGESAGGSLDANAVIQHVGVFTRELTAEELLQLAELAGLA